MTTTFMTQSDVVTVFRLMRGVRTGLTAFSGLSRVALIMTRRAAQPLLIFDHQDLLAPFRPQLRRHYLDGSDWRSDIGETTDWAPLGMAQNAQTTVPHLISFGSYSNPVYYQMWFTEHHSDMCSPGPTERWLQAAAWNLSHDLALGGSNRTDATMNALEYNALPALSHHLASENQRSQLGLNVDAVLECVSRLSVTAEEGSRPSGLLAFVPSARIDSLDMPTVFAGRDLPSLLAHKHVGKLMALARSSNSALVSDGVRLRGVLRGPVPDASLVANFENGRGEIFMMGSPVCSFANGQFSSLRLRPSADTLTAALTRAVRAAGGSTDAIAPTVHLIEAALRRHIGCTIVLDPGHDPAPLAGQRLQGALDSSRSPDVAADMMRVDGAIQLSRSGHIVALGCLLDGPAVAGEDRSRGARYNSAVRFTTMHVDFVVAVVSEDGLFAILHNGCPEPSPPRYKSIDRIEDPLALTTWLERGDT